MTLDLNSKLTCYPTAKFLTLLVLLSSVASLMNFMSCGLPDIVHPLHAMSLKNAKLSSHLAHKKKENQNNPKSKNSPKTN